MSIQESYNRVVEEIQSQTDIISQIRATLANKATSSGGITPSGTLNISENGTFDVTQYASANVNVQTNGSSGGLVAKIGSTTSNVIETGLSSISYFIVQRSPYTSTGLNQGIYVASSNTFTYSYCSSVSQNYGITIALSSYGSTGVASDFTVNGGTFTWNNNTENHKMTGGTYSWYAIGTE